jgi:fibronectin type 3 domain-containing protein
VVQQKSSSAGAKHHKRKADATAASSQLANAITALATGSCGAGREEQKKKRSGKINASDVFRKYAGNATHESYIAQLQEDDDVAQARVEAVWEELSDQKFDCNQLKVGQMKDLLINKYKQQSSKMNSLKKAELQKVLAPLVLQELQAQPALPPPDPAVASPAAVRRAPARNAAPSAEQMCAS